MEKKNLFPNNFKTVLLDSIAGKKNWFLISFAILIITVLIMPLLLISEIQEGNIVVGMIEIFILVFINCIIDFSYLHDNRKLGYYLSKPMTSLQRVNITIITNFIFTAVLIGILGVINMIAGVDVHEMYIITIPWLITGIITAAFSSILTGNSLAAAVATVVNFTLPLSFLAILNYLFTIIEDLALGFNANILFNSFVDNYYKVNNLYFLNYFDDGINWTYFFQLAVIMTVLYLIGFKLLKRRKNERTTELVVYDGYKYFISLFLATLVPIGFSLALRTESFVGKMAVFVLLSALGYYIINAILEKSFSPSFKGLKMYIIYLVIFALFIVGGNIATNQYEYYIPEAEEVEYAFIGNSMYHYQQEWERSRQVYDFNLEDIEEESFKENVDVYTSAKSIDNIIDIHQHILEDQSYYLNQNVIITYVMKDGDNLTRYYNLEQAEDYNGDYLNSKAKEILSTEEFESRLPYNNKYFNKSYIDNINFEINDENGYKTHDISDIDIEKLKINLEKDYQNYLQESKYSFEILIRPDANRSPDYYIERRIEEDKEVETAVPEVKPETYYRNYSIFYETSETGNMKYMRYDIQINEDFENTVNMLEDYLNIEIK
ncbi:MAG TPA: hypothetical protein DHM42_05610 [Clostridiales bacterium]|jgi:hypothetical protein|nr:hypothetical protein [Clostridiales bacterium]